MQPTAVLTSFLRADQFVIIDCERGHINTAADLSPVVEAVAAAGASPIVRVLASEPKRIRWAQDSGAHGVMVAMCETKTQAERAIVATGCPSPRFVVIAEIGSRRAVDNIDALFLNPHPLIVNSPSAAASADDDAVRILAAAHRHAKFAGHVSVAAGIMGTSTGADADAGTGAGADADANALVGRRGWQFVSCGAVGQLPPADEEMEMEMERLGRAMLGVRASRGGGRWGSSGPAPVPVPVPVGGGEEYEWDGRDWG
ncbi:uncharacterized protein BKCO1_1900011 [Diplodia corticola]|uniref:Uncharacterized protein n=1 Tax=Diplodia corticola TaxID=236234 RepID=A0A1J9RRG3_9PEZI|nr:uncharacterized protein BKCO1_1900011 [Diplodia corticola]OJD35123.1 hypothetical protein BKCO1_1900011 [Diplodia corticola]